MTDFIPGQRWISAAELQMGLGTVLSVEHRTVTIVFIATAETRTYAKQSAPLSRVAFAPGDTVIDHEGNGLLVTEVREADGLLTYIGADEDGNPAELPEGQLNNFMQLNRPTERLFSGQIDRANWFELRRQTLQQCNRLNRSALYGLTGCRTSLIPHQLYIAHEVANRFAPRVLLADEVGLGKTIEAGLVLHQQLLTERARRVLIVVPETLVHQWLVEMLRRFNLFFSIFDEDRCLAVEEDAQAGNPFHSEQLVLCSLDFLMANIERAEQALAGDWDLLVVDEAHHLEWSPEQPSAEYQFVEELAASTQGVLLLTATPEQLGKASHFARLRLLDPDRFPDFDQFVAEEAGYEPVAMAVEALLGHEVLDADTLDLLRGTVTEGDNQVLIDHLANTAPDSSDNTSARLALVEHLLDRHGTGRVLFRNTRSAIKGFPARKVIAHPLPLPEAYRQLAVTPATDDLLPRLCPERAYADSGLPVSWTQLDPRLQWLAEHLAEVKPAKVLVITASAASALDIVSALRDRFGIHAAVFHEGMSIVERDRAAAFFADPEYGTQVLVCSEIGSEGRNFQFAHQMVLFDLPLNPDLLEQRIGRLDRIGQTETINIHVPCLQDTAQAMLYHWYHEGLDAFETTCPAGPAVFGQVRDALLEALHTPDQDASALIAETRAHHDSLNTELHRGRDRLLEYNSCRPHVASALKAQAMAADEQDTLPAYMEAVFDTFGVQSEPHSEGCTIIRPGEHMLSRFPQLPDDGMTITYSRDTALSFEDAHYLTWEHPMVINAMDLVQGSEMGNTALVAIKHPGVKAGVLLLESLFILEPASTAGLHVNRYLPSTVVRTLLDDKGTALDTQVTPELITNAMVPVDVETAIKVIKAREAVLRALVARSELHAEQQTPKLVSEARDHAGATLQREVDRLKALQRVNPNVRDEEIRFFSDQLAAVNAALDSVRLRLDAVRVIVTT